MENEVSHKIIGAALEVHKILGGAGLLESIYDSCLCKEVVLQGLREQSHLAILTTRSFLCVFVSFAFRQKVAHGVKILSIYE